MSDIVSSGKALYWGTSEWAADEIRGAIEIAERLRLHKPVTEQPQYNLLERARVEREYARLFDETGYGATMWSPLASGLLTGKYRDGIPEDSRGSLAGYGWLAKRLSDERALAKVEALRPIADELGCTLAQLSLAWCTTNPNVSTVITGASRPSQVVENFEALRGHPQARRRRAWPASTPPSGDTVASGAIADGVEQAGDVLVVDVGDDTGAHDAAAIGEPELVDGLDGVGVAGPRGDALGGEGARRPRPGDGRRR